MRRFDLGTLLIALFVIGFSTHGLLTVATRPVYAQSHVPGPAWSCSLDNIGATLTLCHDRAAAGKRLWITDIIAQSTTSTAGQMILQYGTGTACATGTASLLPSAASAVRIAYPANTAAPTHLRFVTPIAPPDGKDLCVLAVNTNTISIQIMGYVGP